MSEVNRDGTGYLLPYRPKPQEGESPAAYAERCEKSPCATGTLTIDGVKLHLSAWHMTTQNGRKGYSLRVAYPKDCAKRLVASEEEAPEPLPF